ncbi:hypothetical protein KSD_97190 [Ktedonobacter sp. SOSP1-85]|uniref:YciI family protein n=1 Tax=Ktedonobacter sp. SOSP1-85 TaxID=2778367 RepID=UPI0019167492|nr:YciI family protein [Ktedonobacter sp. SOSP1-85]GHO81948.1 hypothetical protein KSD_97190 [Ktedonobacter sp. SOSP1-85]
MLFAMFYTPGLNWIQGKLVTEQDLEEHTRYMMRLDGDNVLVIAGPLMDDAGGLNIINVQSQEEADKVIEADPAIRAGICKGVAHPWHPLISHNLGEFNHIANIRSEVSH